MATPRHLLRHALHLPPHLVLAQPARKLLGHPPGQVALVLEAAQTCLETC
jgi:hypothetical protein